MIRVATGVLVIAGVLTASAYSGELSVDDFTFKGPLGSKGATIEKAGDNHFRVKLAPSVAKPSWRNMLQFTILRHAKGKALCVDCDSPGVRKFVSYSYDARTWKPVVAKRVKVGKESLARLQFPAFTEDKVYVGGEVPMSYEDQAALMHGWAKHPHATLHVIGKSLEGRDVLRLTVTDPDSPHPRKARWVHHVVNQHCYEYNSQWRIAGMVDWLLSDAGADCRRRHIAHFVVMMNVDGPSNGFSRDTSQGIDMNRSYSASGTNKAKQANEAFIVQRDLEQLNANDAPITTTWSMHTWAGNQMEMMLRPGPEMGTVVGKPEALRAIFERNDVRNQVKPLRLLTSALSPTHWCSGTHKQFGVSAFCCEGSADIYTKEENLHTGVVLMKSLAEFYTGTRPTK